MRPVRDTGIAVRGARRRHRKAPSLYPLLIAFSIITIVVMIFLIGRGSSAETRDSAMASTDTESTTEATEPEREPTPHLAKYGDLVLHIPIDPDDVTAVAFHQASGELALHLTSLVPDADMDLANELKAVPPVQGTFLSDPDAGSEDALWQGCALRLWRSNRTGMPDTAVDCGADPGTPVFSPVTGTVVRVKPYLLYDKYDDFEIHIQPDGTDDIDVVLIHVTDLQIAEGDRVKAGVTHIAAVRMMSDKIQMQLGGYTDNGGDHVHVQLNAIAGSDLSGTDGS